MARHSISAWRQNTRPRGPSRSCPAAAAAPPKPWRGRAFARTCSSSAAASRSSTSCATSAAHRRLAARGVPRRRFVPLRLVSERDGAPPRRPRLRRGGVAEAHCGAPRRARCRARPQVGAARVPRRRHRESVGWVARVPRRVGGARARSRSDSGSDAAERRRRSGRAIAPAAAQCSSIGATRYPTPVKCAALSHRANQTASWFSTWCAAAPRFRCAAPVSCVQLRRAGCTARSALASPPNARNFAMWKSGPHASKQQLSLQQQLTQQRVVIAAMRQQHADELSLLREARSEVATLRATVSELRREIKTHRASILYPGVGRAAVALTRRRASGCGTRATGGDRAWRRRNRTARATRTASSAGARRRRSRSSAGGAATARGTSSASSASTHR